MNAVSDADLIERLHYRVNNPSAWPEGFDQAASDLISDAVKINEVRP